jgi:3-oxoacyl-[acyl-carrier protein] reductase
MRLEGKTAIVTGSGRGIGKAIAMGFAEEGAQVVVTARTPEEIAEVAEEIAANGGKALAAECDVTDEEGVKGLVKQAADSFGGVDILVNNAGVGTARPVWGLSLDAFMHVIDVNLVGTFLCTKHVWRPMKEGGGGSIINVSSMGGIVGYPMLSAYCASKSGQIGLTKACAEEGKVDGIRVNAIAPGKGDTKLRASIPEDKARLLKPEDHVGVSIFLASDEAQYVTGQVIPLEWYGPD